MRKARGVWIPLFLTVVIAAGVAGHAAEGVPPHDSVAQAAQLDPADPDDLVVMLADPELAETGIRALLANLGIGIYTPAGQQVQAGSETGESDFWIYDFQIPLLVALSEAPLRPLSGLAEVLAEAGLETEADELAALYWDVYSQHSETFLVRFLLASGLELDSLEAVTGLQEWLLALDTLMAPNQPGPTAARGPRLASLAPDWALALPSVLMASDQGAAADPYYGPALSGWGYACGAADYGEVVAAEAAFRALNGMLFSAALRVSLVAEPDLVHEGHGGPGETATLKVEVISDFTPVPVPLTYGHLTALPLPGVTGPISDAEVHWDLPPLLESRGTVTHADGAPLLPGIATRTDMLGIAQLEFQAQQEEADGYGYETAETALVFAEVDVRPALLAAGVDPLFVHGYIRPSFRVLTPFTVEWHEEDNPIRIEAQVQLEESWFIDGVHGHRWSASWSHKVSARLISLAELAETPPEEGLELDSVMVFVNQTETYRSPAAEEDDLAPEDMLMFVSRPQQIQNATYRLRNSCYCGACNYPADSLTRRWGGDLYYEQWDRPTIVIYSDGDEALVVYYLPAMYFLHPGWPACEATDPIEPGTEAGLHFDLKYEIPLSDRPPGADRSTHTYILEGIVVARIPCNELYEGTTVTDSYHFSDSIGDASELTRGSLRINLRLISGESARD